VGEVLRDRGLKLSHQARARAHLGAEGSPARSRKAKDLARL
jgi:hypothetical protein